MERELRVLKDGYLLVEYSFRYATQISGKVNVATYNSYDIGDGIKTVYPSHKYELYVNHRHELKTIEEIKAFDLDFVKKDPYISKELIGSLEFVYEPRHYRYVIAFRDGTIG